MDANFHIFQIDQKLGQAAAEYVADLSVQATAKRKHFTVAVSGGSLPKILFPSLVSEPLRSQVDWSKWYVFWADERCVPLTDPDSNYRLTRDYLFDHVDIPPAQIIPINDALDPAAAATAYQHKLAQVFAPPPGQPPRFDLMLLGMGQDGHTASLFPGHSLLHEEELWVAPIFDSPKPPPERITLTLPVINHARHVVFIVTGASKVKALSAIVKGNSSLPAELVQPIHGELDWFVDEAAAAGIAN
jgi:6-phosphogluconolactonase